MQEAPSPLLFLIDLTVLKPTTKLDASAARLHAQTLLRNLCAAIDRLVVHNQPDTHFSFQAIQSSYAQQYQSVTASSPQPASRQALVELRKVLRRQITPVLTRGSSKPQLAPLSAAAESLIAATGEPSYDSFLDDKNSHDRSTSLFVFSTVPPTESDFITFAPFVEEISAARTFSRPKNLLSHPERANLVWVDCSPSPSQSSPPNFTTWLTNQNARLIPLGSIIQDRRIVPARVAVHSAMRPAPVTKGMNTDFITHTTNRETGKAIRLLFKARLSNLCAQRSQATRILLVAKHFVKGSVDDADMIRAGAFGKLPCILSPCRGGTSPTVTDGNVWSETFAGLMTRMVRTRCNLAVEMFEMNGTEPLNSQYGLVSVLTPMSACLRIVSPEAVRMKAPLTFDSPSFSAWRDVQYGSHVQSACSARVGIIREEHLCNPFPKWFSLGGREKKKEIEDERESKRIAELLEFKEHGVPRRTTSFLQDQLKVVNMAHHIRRDALEMKKMQKGLLVNLRARLEEHDRSVIPVPDTETILEEKVHDATNTDENYEALNMDERDWDPLLPFESCRSICAGQDIVEHGESRAKAIIEERVQDLILPLEMHQNTCVQPPASCTIVRGPEKARNVNLSLGKFVEVEVPQKVLNTNVRTQHDHRNQRHSISAAKMCLEEKGSEMLVPGQTHQVASVADRELDPAVPLESSSSIYAPPLATAPTVQESDRIIIENLCHKTYLEVAHEQEMSSQDPNTIAPTTPPILTEWRGQEGIQRADIENREVAPIATPMEDKDVTVNTTTVPIMSIDLSNTGISHGQNNDLDGTKLCVGKERDSESFPHETKCEAPLSKTMEILRPILTNASSDVDGSGKVLIHPQSSNNNVTNGDGNFKTKIAQEEGVQDGQEEDGGDGGDGECGEGNWEEQLQKLGSLRAVAARVTAAIRSVLDSKDARRWRSGVQSCLDELKDLTEIVLREGKIDDKVRKLVKGRVGKKDSICSNLQAARTHMRVSGGMVDTDLSQGQWTAIMEALEQIVWLSAAATFSLRRKRTRKRMKRYAKRVRTIVSCIQVCGELAYGKKESRDLFDDCFAKLFRWLIMPFRNGWDGRAPTEWVTKLSEEYSGGLTLVSPDKKLRNVSRQGDMPVGGAITQLRKRSREEMEEDELNNSGNRYPEERVRKLSRAEPPPETRYEHEPEARPETPLHFRSTVTSTGENYKEKHKISKVMGKDLKVMAAKLKERKVQKALVGRSRFSSAENRLRTGGNNAHNALAIAKETKSRKGKSSSSKRKQQIVEEGKRKKRMDALFEGLRQTVSKDGDDDVRDSVPIQKEVKIPKVGRFTLDESAMAIADDDDVFQCMSPGEDDSPLMVSFEQPGASCPDGDLASGEWHSGAGSSGDAETVGASNRGKRDEPFVYDTPDDQRQVKFDTAAGNTVHGSDYSNEGEGGDNGDDLFVPETPLY